MEVEASGIVDWGAVTYYSAKSLAGPGNAAMAQRVLTGWVMDSNGQSEPRYCKNNRPQYGGSENQKAWVICPEALPRDIFLCTNTTTGKTSLCQRPSAQLTALRNGPPVQTNISSCRPGIDTAHALLPWHQQLPVNGLQLEVRLNVTLNMTLCPAHASSVGSSSTGSTGNDGLDLGAGGGGAGFVGVRVLQSAGCTSGDCPEQTVVGYDLATRQLYVDRSNSSVLPAAQPGGGALLPSGVQGYGVRSREVAPLPEVEAVQRGSGSLLITVVVDHSILTVFANDAAVITTRVYTSSANSTGVSVFSSGPIGVEGVVQVWPLSL
jgi:hypothetical protein